MLSSAWLQTQLALLRLDHSRKSLFVPDLLVPHAWQTAILDQPTPMYKVRSEGTSWHKTPLA